MDVISIIAAVLDQPAIQEPAAEFVAALIKAKVPGAVEKDLKDFVTLVASKL